MDWLIALFNTNDSVAHIVLLYSVVIAGGVLLGKVKIGGISLGVTFVLFVGILAGHIKFTAPINILTFMQDFGLILFVFCIGLQVGPGFFESFKKGGIKLNLLSVSLILLNVAVMFACYFIFFDTKDSSSLHLLRHYGRQCAPHDGWNTFGCSNEHAWSWCSQRSSIKYGEIVPQWSTANSFGVCVCLSFGCARYYRCNYSR